MKYNPLTRRMFLHGAGSMLAIPLLPSLLPKAEAAGAPPMRLVMMLGKLGRDASEWYPKIADSSLSQVAPGVLATPLANIPKPLSFTLGSAFDPVMNKMTVIRGLDCMSTMGNHNQSVPTTGSSYAPASSMGFGYSIDALLEESALFYPTRPMLGAIRTDAHAIDEPSEWNSYSFTSKTTRGQIIPSEWNPLNLYNGLFSGQAVQDINGSNSRIRNVTDLVLANFKKTMSSRAIASDDRRRLDNYMSLISDTQKQLSVVAKICGQAAPPTISPQLTTVMMSEIHKAMMKLEIAALACGTTKIVMHVVKYSGDVLLNDPKFSATGFSSHWHQQAHGGDFAIDPTTGRSYLSAYNKFNTDMLAYFLTELDKVDEGGSTLLDNTMFIYGNEDGTGSHEHFDLPVLVAGGQGHVKLGQFIDYRARPFIDMISPTINAIRKSTLMAGRPYNSFLITLLKAFGLGPADYQKFGLTGFGRYEHPNLMAKDYYKQFLGSTINDPLPYLWNH